jgi:hypothetical protein
MKTFLSAVSGLTVSLSSLGFLSGMEGAKSDAIWRHDLEAARREALVQGKPLLVVFR